MSTKRARGSNFQRGAGVYCCRMCKRQTRGGADPSNAGVRLCEQCYEYAGLENAVNDGDDRPAYREEMARLKVEIAALGGDVSRL